MILNNTQANIFKVNGGIADNFANRPAASGSFYIFYSIDTQEIYYDNGTWIKLGSGSSALNIYNSNGTLTGTRTLSGNNQSLYFKDLNSFILDTNVLNASHNFFSFDGNINFTRYQLYSANSGKNYGLYSEINTSGNKFLSFGVLNANEICLKLDITNKELSIVNTQGYAFAGQAQGLLISLSQQRYNLGHIISNGLTLQLDNSQSRLTLFCNPLLSGGSSNGIFLDLTNNRNYLFGQFNGGSQTHLRVSDLNAQITGNFSGSVNGIRLAQTTHTFGFISGTNTNVLRFNSNLTVGFYYNNVLNGLNIQHESVISGLERYDFGRFYGAANTQYKITLTDAACFLNYKGIATWGLTAAQAEFGYVPGNGSNIRLDSSGNINISGLTQILLNGTGITQGTSGAVSGQHLKVRINNVDYVIELKNP